MKKFFLIILPLFVLLSFGACKANEDQTNTTFCQETQQARKFCQVARVDCATVMQHANENIIEKIKACPTTAADDQSPQQTEKEYPEIGLIPCCIAFSKFE